MKLGRYIFRSDEFLGVAKKGGLNFILRPIFTGVISGSPTTTLAACSVSYTNLSYVFGQIFYPIQITGVTPEIDISDLTITDTFKHSTLSKDFTCSAMEQLCSDPESAGFHFHDDFNRDTAASAGTGYRGYSVKRGTTWFVLGNNILYTRDGISWVAFHPNSSTRGSKKYIDRKYRIIREMLGSSVKVTDKKLFNNPEFAHRPGKVICTIPKYGSFPSSNELLQAVVVKFNSNIGGCSMDGKFEKGSCLVVPFRKLEKIKER